ncbi:hypothetical protein HY484_01720 [Candidatus Woesearchaeota archaeon]|nr:hypothetical protein [Candidatus Woesearchaeota archaeon]
MIDYKQRAIDEILTDLGFKKGENTHAQYIIKPKEYLRFDGSPITTIQADEPTVLMKILRFSDEQLDMIGRILSLDEDKELIRFTYIDRYEDFYFSKGPVIDISKNRKVTIFALLQQVHNREVLRLTVEEHETLVHRIRTALEKRRIGTLQLNDLSALSSKTNFFCYHAGSYGLEMEGIDVLIGCLHYRTDVKLHPRDCVATK